MLREVTPSYAKIREQHGELRTNSTFEAPTRPRKNDGLLEQIERKAEKGSIVQDLTAGQRARLVMTQHNRTLRRRIETRLPQLHSR